MLVTQNNKRDGHLILYMENTEDTETIVIKRFEPFVLGVCNCAKECGTAIPIRSKRRYIQRFVHHHDRNNGGRCLTTDGYIRIHKPDHPNAVNGYVLEHRLIYEHYLYILFDEPVYIPTNIVMDHKDKNKQNNALINIKPLTQSEHLSHHMEGNNYGKKDMTERRCIVCGSTETKLAKGNKTPYHHWMKKGNYFQCKKCWMQEYDRKRRSKAK